MNEKLTPEGVHSDDPPFFDVPGADVTIFSDLAFSVKHGQKLRQK